MECLILLALSAVAGALIGSTIKYIRENGAWWLPGSQEEAEKRKAELLENEPPGL